MLFPPCMILRRRLRSFFNDLEKLSQLSHGFVELHNGLFLHLISKESSSTCWSNLYFSVASSFWRCLCINLCLFSSSQDSSQNSLDLNQFPDYKIEFLLYNTIFIYTVFVFMIWNPKFNIWVSSKLPAFDTIESCDLIAHLRSDKGIGSYNIEMQM